jgi:hypothetical protein
MLFVFLDSKLRQYWSLPFAVTKKGPAILALCQCSRPLMAIFWHAGISAAKVTACFR